MLYKIFQETKVAVTMLVVLGVFFVTVFAGINWLTTRNMQVMRDTVVQISESAAKIEGKRASDAAVKALRKEFDDEKSQIMAAYEEQRKRTGETLDELGKVKAELVKSRSLNVNSDKIYRKENQDKKLWYFFKKITVRNADGDEVPVAWAMFHPYQDPDRQWDAGTYDMSSTTRVVETQNVDGSFNRYAEVDLTGHGGKKLPVKLKEIKWEKVELKEKRFFWWNPRVALAAQLSPDGAAVGLDVSVASYGRTERDMDWRFLSVGLSSSADWQNPSLTLEPFSWNIGGPLPLVDNLFVGPYYGIGIDGGEQFGLKLAIPF